MKEYRARRIVGLLLLLAGIVSSVVLAMTFFATGDCVSSGGSYNYAADLCDHVTNHPFIPFYKNWVFWIASITFILGAIVVGRDLDQTAA